MRISRRSAIELKIKSLSCLEKIAESLRKRGKRVVFTNGCFDILHYGHAKYLEEAKSKGDVLIVGINSDSSIRRIKGPRRPVIKEHDRLRLISALESVDYAVLFSGDTPIRLIRSIKPDILIKGSDWDKAGIVGADFVSSYGGKVETVRLLNGRSTTNLIKKIAKNF